MSDLSYTVEVKGVKDIERLENTIEKLHSTLSAGHGAGKSLEELRKILVGMKGQASVIEDLRRSVTSLDNATANMKNSFKESIGGLGTIIKQEMAHLRGTIQTAGLSAGRELGDGFAKGIETSGDKAVKAARTAAAKARSEMTAMYNTLVGGNGLAQLSTNQLGEVAMLRDSGATISRYHAQMLKNYEGHLQKQRQVDNAFEQAQRDHSNKLNAGYAKQYQEQVSALNSRIALARQEGERMRVELEKQAAQEQALRNQYYRQQFQNYGANLGIGATAKSAKDSFSVFESAGLVPQLEKAKSGALGLSAAFKTLEGNGNNVHSMARGLASGFNLLWLTWGNLAPLFAGAVISNGFMQTAKQGMQVAHTLEIITHLGENSKESMQTLTDELIRLGNNGPRGPLEIAEALKTLSLAGLQANEILAVTGNVLNFSMAGTTDIQTAADVLVSVTTAFGTGAAGFERSADIIMRAAADSKASVESFGEALKTASVVGEQYGATQEDVALQIQYLANLGIQGSAAGTAIRNMYADITGRSGQVSKILKSFGLDFKDAEGNVVSLNEQMRQLTDLLSGYDAKSQGNIIQAIFGERGAKSAVAALQAYQTAAKDTSKFANKLEEDYAKLASAAGDSAIAAANLAQSTENSFKAAGATLRTTMFEAFQEMEPQLYSVAQSFRAAFGDEETKRLLVSMTSTVASLGEAVAENLVPLANVAMAWGAYRVALAATVQGASAYMAISAAMAARKAATTAVTVADTAATEANTAAKVRNGLAMGGMAGAALKALPVIGNMVAIGTSLWMVYSSMVDKSGKSVDDFAISKSKNILEALQKENDHIEKVNAARLEGIGLMEAEARVRAENAKSALVADSTSTESLAAQRLADLELEISKAKSAGGSANNAEYIRQLEHQRAEEARVLGGIRAQRGMLYSKLQLEEERRRKNARDSYLIAKAEAQKEANEATKIVAGAGQWSIDEFQSGLRGGRGFERVQQDRDNELKAIQAHQDSQFAIKKDAYDREKRLLDARRAGELISEDEYLRKTYELTTSYEAEQIALLERSNQEIVAKTSQRILELERLRDSANKPETKEAYTQAIEREYNDLSALTAKRAAESAKIRAEASERLQQSLIKLESVTGKLLKADSEYWDKIGRESAREAQARKLEARYAIINDSIFSMQGGMKAAEKAQQAFNDKHEEHLVALEKQAELHRENLKWYSKYLQELQKNPEASEIDKAAAQKIVDSLQDAVLKTEQALAESTARGLAQGAEEGYRAMEQFRQEEASKLRDEIADAISDGILGDSKSIGKRLRDILQREFINKPLTFAVRASVDWLMNMAGMRTNTAGGQVIGGQGISVFGGGGGSLTNWSSWGSSSSDWLMTQSTKLGLDGWNTMSDAAYKLGETIQGVDNWLKEIPGMGGGIGSAFGYGQALYSLTQGNYGQAIGTAIGTWALPGIGTMIGSTLGGLVDGLFGGGTPHTGAAAEYYQGGIVNSGKGYTKSAANNAKYTENLQGPISGVAQAIGGGFDAMAALFGQQAGYKVATGFTADGDDKSHGLFRVTNAEGEQLVQWLAKRSGEYGSRKTGYGYSSDAEKGYDQYLASVTAATIPLLKDIVPTWADGMLDSLSSSLGLTGEKGDWKSIESGSGAFDSLNAVIQQIVQVEAAFKSLGNAMSMFSDLSDDMKTALLGGLGGIEGVTATAQSYYESYYSEQERYEASLKQMRDVLASLNVSIDPAMGDRAKASFRAAVEGAFDAGHSELATKLLAINQEFAVLADYAQNAGAAVDSVSGALSDVMRDLLDERKTLEAELLRAQGNEAGYLAAMRAISTEGYTEAERAAWDYNAALQSQIDALDAAAAAVGNAWSNLGTMSGLAAQYTGNTSGLKAQLGTVKASFAGATDTNARVAALQQIISLEQSIWNAQQASRQAEQQAAQKRAEAAREQLQSVNQLLSAAKGLGDYASKLFMSEQSGLSDAERLAALGSEYSSLMARAKTGDADALQDLQGVSSDYLRLAEQMSASQADYSVLSGTIAAELASAAAIQEAAATSQAARLERQIEAAERAAEFASAQFQVSTGTQKLIDSLLAESVLGFATEAQQMAQLITSGQMTVEGIDNLPAELAGLLNATLVPTISGIADAARAAAAAAQSSAAMAASAISTAQASSLQVPGFASGGLHSGGIRLVGERGPELEVTGPARYWSANQTAQMLAGGSGNAEVVAELRKLREQNARLEVQLARIKESTGQTYELLDTVTASGNAMATEVMNGGLDLDLLSIYEEAKA